MKTKERNTTVHYLLTQLTYMMLAKSPVKDAMQKAAEKHEGQLRAQLNQEQFEPIGVMRDVIDELARMLADCTSVESLQQAHGYIKALNEGQVLLVKQDQETGAVVGYQPNA
jgi:phosphoenolpyruvate carboxylase